MNDLQKRGTQRGIALLTALLLLVLLSALALGLMYMSSTETQINSNFRSEQNAYFAAKAGMEEMRDRMMAANTNSISSLLPTVGPTSATSGILYMLNEGATANSVKPYIWTAGNKYSDTELCHDGYSVLSLSTPANDVPCTTASQLPSGTPTVTATASQLPFFGTSAALPFKWARLSVKLNGSVPNHTVNSSASATNVVCWNGVYEVVSSTNCSALSPNANPVYLITALAVTPNTNARKMVQGEVALNPAQPFPYGLFATGTGCSAVSLSGNISTDSYTTASGGTYSTTKTSTGGDVGANGNVYANGSVSIGGSVGSSAYPATQGACPGNAFTTVGGAGMTTGNSLLTLTNPNIPTPSIPNVTGPAESDPGTLPAGNYGDLTIKHGTTTLGPGTYNVNSITISANGVLAISGAVTINVVGNGVDPAIDLEGKGVSNPSGIAANLQINYAGTVPGTACPTPPCGNVKITGGNNGYMVVDAPMSTVSLGGNSAIYGSVIGYKLTNFGDFNFHYDKNLKSPVPSNSYYSLVSFRELYY